MKALEAGKVILFRVPTLPKEKCEFCFVVHDGAIRGFTSLREYAEVEDGVVEDPISGEFWPAGNYLVRSPYWHPLDEPIPMKGFQGYRYYERPQEVVDYTMNENWKCPMCDERAFDADSLGVHIRAEHPFTDREMEELDDSEVAGPLEGKMSDEEIARMEEIFQKFS